MAHTYRCTVPGTTAASGGTSTVYYPAAASVVAAHYETILVLFWRAVGGELSRMSRRLPVLCTTVLLLPGTSTIL